MKKIIFLILILFIIAAPITYLIILIIDKLIVPYLPFVILEGSKDAWINFFGTLFSGITTLIALLFTIKHENQKQKKEEIKYIRPFILIKPILKKDFDDTVENNNYFYYFSTRVENISENLVKDLQLVEEKVFEFNEETKKYDLNQQELLETDNTNYCIYTVLLDDFKIIAPHSFFDFQTNLIINNYSESSKISDKSFYIKFLIKYRDTMDRMEYYSQLDYEFIINYTRDKKIHIFINNVRNTIVKECFINN